MRTIIAKQARQLRSWLLRENRTEVRGYQQLEWLLRDISRPVPMTHMSIQPATLAWIVNDIRVNNRRMIVELGGGSSTQLIAQCLKREDDGQSAPRRYFCVEDNADWIAYLGNLLREDGLEQYVTFVHAPREVDADGSGWYSEDILKTAMEGVQPDLLIVDGPTVKHRAQEADRFGAYRFFRDKMAPGCSIFVDDVDRPAERKMLAAWSQWAEAEADTLNAYVGVVARGQRYVSKPF